MCIDGICSLHKSGLCSCVIHLWDLNHEGMWENHSLYSHYTDFLLEMVALSVDLMHHLHMIVSSTG